jgi:hypothetical protein
MTVEDMDLFGYGRLVWFAIHELLTIQVVSVITSDKLLTYA